MRVLLLFFVLFLSSVSEWTVEAIVAGGITKHFKNFNPVLKWGRNSPRIAEISENAPQFENGYFVETLVDGNKLGFVPYTIRVSSEGELFAVDSENNNIVKITPPLSQYSRARLVAGSFQGYSGHVDGKSSDSRFTHPKGVAMDEKGNVYVADTANMAIRKIGESGVTTIAGGKSNAAGYRDGPSEDAKFSNDFDIVYVARMCSLLVVDRGNAALRQISLQQEDCNPHYNSISNSDIVMVVGAILAGYISCLVQQGLGSSFFSKKPSPISKPRNQASLPKPSAFVVESLKEETAAGWPSPGQLISDLAKLAVEAAYSSLLNIVVFPRSLLPEKKGLTPLKDNLILPEDKTEQPPPPPVARKHAKTSAVESVGSSNINIDTPVRHLKSAKPPPKHKDSKHRSAKKQDCADFYGGEAAQIGSKAQKERSRHRHREKMPEIAFGAAAGEPKSVEVKPKEYTNEQKFDLYKYSTENAYRF